MRCCYCVIYGALWLSQSVSWFCLLLFFSHLILLLLFLSVFRGANLQSLGSCVPIEPTRKIDRVSYRPFRGNLYNCALHSPIYSSSNWPFASNIPDFISFHEPKPTSIDSIFDLWIIPIKSSKYMQRYLAEGSALCSGISWMKNVEFRILMEYRIALRRSQREKK